MRAACLQKPAFSAFVLLTGSLFTYPFAAFADPIPVSTLVVFGDSLSDNGNAYIGSLGVFPGPNYALNPYGEYTNGTNTTPATTGPLGLWSDQLAQKLGVPDPLPFLSQKTGATDFAVGLAQTGTNGLSFVTDQVNLYLASVLGSASAQSLYTFWAGANDIADQGNPAHAADNIANNIRTLAAKGATNFLWLNLPPLGETPKGLALNSITPGTTAYLNAQSAEFNAEWQTDIGQLHTSGINVIGVDVNSIFDAIAANSAAHCTVGPGNPFCFANITSPAQGLAGVDPNTYVFWDLEHPTTQTDSLVASLAFNDLQPVPEPVSGALAIAGLGLLGIAALRKR
ncbi:MAG TPA: SGNH/GDSL hydrolase family protein [Bryobacteraceae bacterium]|jgi:phospholipase/lecithinase/hemolysin|nr:SGNH/GDSL hydrolase family protein [Bryobacteraceae bacterium]